MADLAIKEINMSKSAKTKRTIIEFYKKHGMAATLDAYGYSRSIVSSFAISRRFVALPSHLETLSSRYVAMTYYVGGLLGYGQASQIISSYAVVGSYESPGSITGGIGSLNGYGVNAVINTSYAVFGDFDHSPLVFNPRGGQSQVNFSYWDSTTSGILVGQYGEHKTSKELQSPRGYASIYANWYDEPRVPIYSLAYSNGRLLPQAELLAAEFRTNCDDNFNGAIDAAEQNSLIWDFGSSTEYPAIRCTPLSPAEQRELWSTDGEGNINVFLSSFLPASLEAGPDSDGDTIVDRLDMDDDGDGLIELATAAQLDGCIISGTYWTLSLSKMAS